MCRGFFIALGQVPKELCFKMPPRITVPCWSFYPPWRSAFCGTFQAPTERCGIGWGWQGICPQGLYHPQNLVQDRSIFLLSLVVCGKDPFATSLGDIERLVIYSLHSLQSKGCFPASFFLCFLEFSVFLEFILLFIPVKIRLPEFMRLFFKIEKILVANKSILIEHEYSTSKMEWPVVTQEWGTQIIEPDYKLQALNKLKANHIWKESFSFLKINSISD